ncbi:MAG: VOC family protein [Planctomycetales bacterium]|nr:VOC family protein [Planctomycetales bacterium]
MTLQKIKPFLWYDSGAEQAAEFYCGLFPDSRIHKVSRYPEGGMAPAGTVMTVEFSLAGVEYVALNGGPVFKFSEAISLAVSCENQAEVDHLWDNLLADGGSASMCGWLKDRWGLSWQIVPRILPELLASPEPGVAQRVTAAMLNMVKLDIAALERAAAGE